MDIKGLSFYISGIVQGSVDGNKIVNQNYREKIKKIIIKFYPNSIIHCPYELFKNVNSLPINKATNIFESMVNLAEESDVVISYIPEASMGSAVEIWSAKRNGKIVITISNLKHNLLIQYASTIVIPSIKSFSNLLEIGWLDNRLNSLMLK